MEFLKNIIVILIGLLSLATNIPVSAGTIVIAQSQHVDVSRIYNYFDIESSAQGAKVDRSGRLSLGLSIKEERSGHEVLVGVTSVAAMGGATFANPVQSYGNSMYFGDPVMTGRQFLMGVGIGALTGGVINGGIAAYNGRGFWNGSFSQQQAVPIKPIPTKPNSLENNNLDLVKREISKLSS